MNKISETTGENTMQNIEIANGVHLVDDANGKGTVTNSPEATTTPGKKKGRVKGTKVLHTVPHNVFIPKYRELVEEGKSLSEIATYFNLKVQTVIQKRLAYNKDSAKAGNPQNLPLPKSTGTRGPKKIDWAAMSTKITEAVNS
jgi:hypothetical protein